MSGDAANITGYVSKDNGAVTVLGDTSAAEDEATNAKGFYTLDLTQAETNADKLKFSAKSTTANVVVIGVPAVVYTNVMLGNVNHGGAAATLELGQGASIYSSTGPGLAIFSTTAEGLYIEGITNAIRCTGVIAANITGNITGALSGAVGSVTAAVTITAASVQAIWDALTAALTTANSIGKLLVDNINATISSRAASATALSTAQWTNARAGYLDNLNIGGNVASSAEATAIQNNTRVVRVVPEDIELPTAGTRTYRIELFLYDENGNIEAPDSAPTIALVNQAGTDRSARLDSTTMALVETGRYRAIYTSTAGDTKEQLVWAFSVVEGGVTRKYGNTSYVTDAVATDFTSADRAKLDTLHDTRLTAGRASNLDNLDALVSSRLATAGYTAPLDAAGTRAAVGLAAANLDSQLGDIPTVAEFNARTLVAASYSTLTTAQVNAEMLDVLSVDTFAEPVGVPVATATLSEKIGRLYQALRNKLTITSSKKQFYSDAEVALWEKDLADDGTTYSESEGNAP